MGLPSRVRCLRALVCLHGLVLVSVSVSQASKTKLSGQNSNQNASFPPPRDLKTLVDASIGAAFARLIGPSVGLAGFQGRPEGRRRGLASCLNWVKRCQALRSPRSRTALLNVPPLRPRSGRPPDKNRLKSVWRDAQRSPGVKPRHLDVSDDVRASFHRVRDAQRPRCPFQTPSRGPFVPQTRYAWDTVLPGVYRVSETGASIQHVLRTLRVRVRA
jgi:hypothetical protein